jgi:hypothetical protein
VISRIDEANPPGVSSRRTTTLTCSRAAWSSPLLTCSAVAGPIAPEMSSSIAPGTAVRPCVGASDDDNAKRSINRQHLR